MVVILLLCSSQNPCRKKEQGFDKSEQPVNNYSDKPERKKQQPDNGIEKQGKNGHRPAEKKKDKPEQKFDQHHTFPIMEFKIDCINISMDIYDKKSKKVAV
jgi:hypothetical protein